MNLLSATRVASYFVACLLLAACASTKSMVVPVMSGPALVTVEPLTGDLGPQAADLIVQELITRGVNAAKRGASAPYILSGTVVAEASPLASFPHVKITLQLTEAKSGAVRWTGTYGESLWTSAISTQEDLARGAYDIVDEFIKSGAVGILTAT